MIPTAHPTPQTKWHPYQFSRLCTDDRRVSPYFTMGRPFSPQKFAPSHEGIWTPSNTYFPGPTQVLNPNGSSIGAAVFAGLTSVTDRPRDHATRSVRIGASTYVVLQCGLIISYSCSVTSCFSLSIFCTRLLALIYTVSQKNVPPLACYNIDTHEPILTFFGRNVTNKVSNQKMLYYAKSRALQQLDCVALSSGFPLLQGSTEAQDRCGGKTKQHLISYFLSNTSAKDYHNRIMYVKIIASLMWDVF